MPDLPVRSRNGREGHLLENLSGGFEVLHVRNGAAPVVPDGVKLTVVGEDLLDTQGIFAQRFDAGPGATFVLRPDQHLIARMRGFESGKIEAAISRALGR